MSDLSMAREVQQQLLHREVRRVPGIDLAAACVPAREPGGDFFDLLPYGTGRLALALGDVSGKGIAAALLGALVMGILRAHTVSSREPRCNAVIAVERSMVLKGWSVRIEMKAFIDDLGLLKMILNDLKAGPAWNTGCGPFAD